MANLSFSEKQLIEDVFDMQSGYFLNFGNREFEEFMMDVINYNVYTKYLGLSKAKIFRSFCKDESETFVGKAIVMVINHMRENNLVREDKRIQVDKLYELGKKFLGKINIYSKQKQQVPDLEKEKKNDIDFDSLKKSLLGIEKIDSSQAKGYAFEKYLNNLFKAFDLDPHASYRTEYDQIDGSFVLDGNTILIEAKYKRDPIPKNDLILFSTKIESKSHFPKGLFVSYSTIDDKAIEYYIDRSARIIILTVEELFIICDQKMSLEDVLRAKYRVLDEKGIIFRHVLAL